MAISRVVVLLLGAFAAPSQASRSIQDPIGTGAGLMESCQDYPYEGGFTLHDSVRIFRPNTTFHNFVGLVGCQDLNFPGMICLEGLEGCYKPEELRRASTFVFAFHALSEAAGKIFDAARDDPKDVLKDVELSLSASGVFVTSQIAVGRHLTAVMCKSCDAAKGEMSEQKFDMAAVKTKSLLVMLVDSAAESWGNTTSLAETTMAKLVKIANHLSDQASDFFNDHLKDFVEALERYLGTIAAAVIGFPDVKKPKLNASPPMSEEHTLQEMGEPSGLTAAIEGFIDKVGELSAELVEFSRDVYETVAEGLRALMSGTGRLIAAASSRFSRVKAFVHQLASDAVSKVQEWGRQAAEFACNRDLEEFAGARWALVQEGFSKAMDAVQRGDSLQSVSDTAFSMSDTLAAVAVSISSETASVPTWERDAVQGTLDRIGGEISELKWLVETLHKQRASNSMGDVMNNFETTTNKTKDMAKMVQEDTVVLVGTLLTVGPSVF